jgi:DNA mismatch endonuclease (patch repair protein)
MAGESWASSPAARNVMLGNRSKNTLPEIRLRRELHSLGFRFRIHAKPLADLNRRADIVFRPARVAVFVHGCFWHACPHHFRAPKSNVNYWSTKIEVNTSRDSDTETRLRSAGWLPITVWEHEDSAKAARRIARAVVRRRSTV